MNGIWFNDIHSFDDLNLVLSKVNIPPAEVKTNYVDIPGGDGTVDLTEIFGKVTYKDRECEFIFTMLPQYDFEEKKREISNLLNGKRFKITVDKDPDYYWVGRCFVNEYASNKNLHQIVVGATVAPYKLKQELTKVTIPGHTGRVVVNAWNERKTALPTITCEAKALVLINGTAAMNVSYATTTQSSVELVEGNNEITVDSTKAVVITYQEGAL